MTGPSFRSGRAARSGADPQGKRALFTGEQAASAPPSGGDLEPGLAEGPEAGGERSEAGGERSEAGHLGGAGTGQRPGLDRSRVAGTGEQAGREAFFSAAGPRLGTATLTCERCKARVRVGYPELALMHIPFWLWAPWRTHSRLLKCKVCGHRAWQRVGWLD